MKTPATKHPLGSFFNPQIVKEGYKVSFEYDEGNAFEVFLRQDGTLCVRIYGDHPDLISTHHHVANDVIMAARRWDNNKGRHVDFIKEDKS